MPSRRSLLLSSLILLMGATEACHNVKLNPESAGQLSKLETGGDLITAKRIKAEIPLNPEDPAWGQAKEATITLISQTSVKPRSPVFHKTELKIRGLHNGKALGLLISWADPTKDEFETGAASFRDAVAIGFPMSYGAGIPLPYVGMGNKGRPMNIWHWKASWQADVDRGYRGVAETHEEMVPNVAPIPHRTAEEAGSPMAQTVRKSSVENLVAEGFGTLTSTPSEGLAGKALWKDGRWNVVVKRARRPQGTAVNLSPRGGGLVPMTFAVWDGAGRERNGMKGLTRWRFLYFEGEDVPAASLKLITLGPIPGADPARGRQLVSDMGCIVCHNLPGSPAVNDVGPDLIHAGAVHRVEYLLESIKDPNAVIVPAPGYYDPKTWTSTMPSFGDQVPEKDYEDVVEYLRSLQ